MTGPTQAQRKAVADRDKWQCRRCQGRRGLQIHHRLPRQMGGSSWPLTNHPANLVLLCAGCHEWVESHREQAYEEGWLLRSHWRTTTNPTDVPVAPVGKVVVVRDPQPDVRHDMTEPGSVEPALRLKDANRAANLPFQELTND